MKNNRNGIVPSSHLCRAKSKHGTMPQYLIAILFLLFSFQSNATENTPAKKITISGRVKDKKNGEELIGASVYVKETKSGSSTNTYGFYSISLEPGVYNFVYSFVGYTSIEKQINLKENITINIELEEQAKITKEVVVTGEKQNENIVKTEMSTVKLDAKAIRQIPALMGEVDVIKAIQLLPGVQSTGEGGSGYSVRGGSTDQNLILLDESTVYNASHLMGFFSVFNNDAVKDVKLYKGDIPAEYGGRLSSLLDVRMKEGNLKKFSGSGGIGTISGRVMFEGPIIEDKCSFMVSGRRSWADLFLPLAPNKEIRDNKLFFYDLNAKINYTISDKDRLFLSGYLGRDIFQFGKTDPFRMSWGNQTVTARWNHLFSQKLFANFTFLFSNYNYDLGQNSAIQGFNWTSNLQDESIKADFGYFLNTSNTLKFGLITTLHSFDPGRAKGSGGSSIFNEIAVPGSRALEHAVFLSNEQKVNALLTLNYGLRFSAFQSMGKSTVYNFDGLYNTIDSTVHKEFEFYKNYFGLEPRFGFNFLINEVSSVKGSYSRTNQYVHLASNSTVGTPLDVWLPSSPNIKPQLADQFSLGYFRNLKKNMFETSVEIYYKKMQNQIDFKDHASIFLNPKLEGEIRFGEAYSYGAEFLIRKQTGKLTGWVAYTLSQAKRKVPEINEGRWYTAPYDKTHNVSIVGNYAITDRITVSATWVYSTGAPITLPTGRFTYGNIIAPVYSERNSYRMPDYHRLDIGLTYDFKKDEGDIFEHSLNFSVYNAYYRKNAYMIQLQPNKDDPNITEAYKVYLFPIIPAITYNLKF